jgi:hypothetical protein
MAPLLLLLHPHLGALLVYSIHQPTLAKASYILGRTGALATLALTPSSFQHIAF